MKQLCLFVKLLVIFILILIFYKLYKQSQHSSNNNHILAEGFQNNTITTTPSTTNTTKTTQNMNINYLKLNETYLEPDDTKLELLYTNYSGEEQGKDIWENKTLDQCTDLCNQLDKCIGFSRELINDDAPGKCYPRTIISGCHSNRKGNPLQMQNAIKYNSYIKTNNTNGKNNNVLTKCIGDTNLTLNRSVYIKSQLYPKKYIGTIGDGLVMLVDINEPDFQKKCNFRIEIGKDGIGTVSFLHIDTNTYLYRANSSATTNMITTTMPITTMPITTMPSVNVPTTTSINMTIPMVNKDTLILKDLTANKTIDRQRVSFNILDAMKNLMKFKCLPLDGETVDKYIAINPDNKNYLTCMALSMNTVNTNTNSENENENYIFNIVDDIVKSTIINSKNKLPNTNQNTIQKELFQQTDAIGNVINNGSKIIQTNLDTVKNIPLYRNILETPNNVNIKNYLDDNYGLSPNTTGETYFSVSKKMNDVVINNQLSKSLNKKQEEYEAIKQLNLEIEREIANLNMGLNAKNDKIYNGIDKMRITDMADDYFTLKNITKKNISIN